MSDGKRILEDGPSGVRAVVASADADDAPPADLEARILASLPLVASRGAASTEPAILGAAASQPPLGAVWSRRLAALAALGLGAVIAGSIANKSTSLESAPASAPRGVISAPPAAPAAAVEEAPREGDLKVVTPDALPSAPPSEAVSARTRPTAAKTEADPARSAQAETAATPKSKSASTLAREIALLDAVRVRLAAGEAARADVALAAYDAEFPDGLLRPEATVLRARSLLAQGRRAEAERLAHEYLARDPNSVHATRIRALLAN